MKPKENITIFNSPFELGIRMVYLLCAMRPSSADLQKLILLDYAAVYSGDLGGPPSLHTPVPYRGNEMLSRRALIEQGLHLMSTRGLVDAQLDEQGINYIAGPNALALVGSASAPYFAQLTERCEWAVKQFSHADSANLTLYFSDLGHRWGAEIDGAIQPQGKLWQ